MFFEEDKFNTMLEDLNVLVDLKTTNKRQY
jgi:hypothetical protein